MVEGGDGLDLTFHYRELFELRLSFVIQQNRLGAQWFLSALGIDEGKRLT